jgi:YD repeat-containing protein
MRNAGTRTMLFSVVLLFSLACTKYVAQPDVGRSPVFQGKGTTIDTIHPWQKWADTLRVVDSDSAVSFSLHDTVIRFLLRDSILSIVPGLQDTGTYDFKVFAKDSRNQCDSVRFQVTISPEFVYIDETSKITLHSEGGTIYCGQTTSYGGASSTFTEAYEYNQFGFVSKVTTNDTSSVEYDFTYDSLCFPVKITSSSQTIDYYDSMVYDGNHNEIKDLNIGRNGTVENETDFAFNSQNQMVSMSYSYESQSCNVNNSCSTFTRNDIVQYEYNPAGLMSKMIHTYNGGQLEDSVVYTYDAESRLLAENDYRGQWVYPTQYLYDANGVLTGKVWYQGTGDLGGKDDYTYSAQGKLIRIDDYCGNYSSFSFVESTEYDWITVKAFKTPATTLIDSSARTLYKKRTAIKENANMRFVNSVVANLRKAGKIGTALAFKESWKHRCNP